MNLELKKKIEKILISGTKEELDAVLASYSEEEQKEAIVTILSSSANILEEPNLKNVKSRSLLFYLITNAEKRGIEEDKDVFITYADQRKLGKINKEYGPEVGDDSLGAFIDSIHSGFTGIKKHNYDIVRMGGDEFCIITIGEPIEVVTEYMKEAKTIANNTPVFYQESPIKEKIDFLFGSSKLDYSNGHTLRSIIDEAKNEAYYQELLVEAEEKAEASKIVLIDDDKQTERKKIIKDYVRNLSEHKKNGEDFRYEIIGKKEDTKLTSRKTSDVKLDFDFVMKLTEISQSKGLKKEALIEELYEYDTEFLSENLFAFGQKFIRENEKPGLVKRSSCDLLLDSIGGEHKKFKYIELDNLKLVNSARTHADGDAYIGDFIEMVTSSMTKGGTIDTSYAIKMSGNVLVLCYDEENESIVDEILEKADLYDNKDINIPMDVFTKDMDGEIQTSDDLIESYLDASDEVAIEKSRFSSNIQKIIASKDGYEIFYQRETFSPDEVKEVLDEMAGEDKDIHVAIDEIVSESREGAYAVIQKMYEDGDISQETKELLFERVSFDLAKEEIEEYLEGINIGLNAEEENEEDSDEVLD